MERILNFRPLAEGLFTKDNKKIKEGMIFRSGAPDRATDDDINELHKHKINHIYDLRRDIERTKLNPKVDIEVISYERTHEPHKTSTKSFVDTVLEQGAENHMFAIYESYLPYASLVKSAINDIIHEEKPFLVHCAAGKDRTGAVGAVMMMILGFSDEDIIKEYAKIDPKVIDYAIDVMKSQGHSDETIQALMPMHTVKEDYMRAFLKGIYDQYDTIDEYLEDYIGLTEEQIKIFKEKFMI